MDDHPSSLLWAKCSRKAEHMDWLSLRTHMLDCVSIGTFLWNEWLPTHTKKVIENGLDGLSNNIRSKDVFIFLCCSHDIGKATPDFQRMRIPQNERMHNVFMSNLEQLKLPIDKTISDPGTIHHSLSSECILMRNGIHISIAAIVGSHHGEMPDKIDAKKTERYPENTGFDDDKWKSMQDEIFLETCELSSVKKEQIISIKASVGAQMLLSGLLIMTDWIASNELWFPYGCFSDDDDIIRKRAEIAINQIQIPTKWEPSTIDFDSLFADRFDGKSSRPFQKMIMEYAKNVENPGIVIVEAPMGEGKTEASLAMSEVLCSRFGFGGVFFALPTQATADGIFLRMRDWVEKASKSSMDVNSFFLAHGKSKFNKEYNDMINNSWCDESTASQYAIIHEWFQGRKKGILSDFVAGTVDHVLMGGLKLKHLSMRHLGLGNKVVIVDECHSYDSYMGSYLEKIVQWLGTYNIPVIIMSATLYPSRRKELIEAYMSGREKCTQQITINDSYNYPLITYSNGISVIQNTCKPSGRITDVSINVISDEHLISQIVDVSSEGGYVGIIVNTVSRSQKMYEKLNEIFDKEEIVLIHSKFTCWDRSQRESMLLNMLGPGDRKKPPFRLIVIGTQVIEQSLDFDFDILFTDICPMDLLLQRIGRLHRHENIRPEKCVSPKCFVIDGEKFDKGTEYIYGSYLLYRTKYLLPRKIKIPTDIPRLVHLTYSEKDDFIPTSVLSDYEISKREMKKTENDKIEKAKVFQIKSPWDITDISGLLKNHVRDNNIASSEAIACVRDIENTLDVIAVKIVGDNVISPMSSEIRISTEDSLSFDAAFELSGSMITLPSLLTKGNKLRCTIEYLHSQGEHLIPLEWRKTSFISNNYLLFFDKNNETVIDTIKLRYTDDEGLMVIERD